MVLLKVRRIAACVADNFPKTQWLIRLDARATDIVIHDSGNKECRITNGFGIESKTCASRVITIGRVDLQVFRLVRSMIGDTCET